MQYKVYDFYSQYLIIYLREVLENDIFKNSSSPLTIALGKDIVGNPFVTDLKKLPHLLIAGTTGSGKSVGFLKLEKGHSL